jgi:hypothetical protein
MSTVIRFPRRFSLARIEHAIRRWAHKQTPAYARHCRDMAAIEHVVALVAPYEQAELRARLVAAVEGRRG